MKSIIAIEFSMFFHSLGEYASNNAQIVKPTIILNQWQIVNKEGKSKKPFSYPCKYTAKSLNGNTP